MLTDLRCWLRRFFATKNHTTGRRRRLNRTGRRMCFEQLEDRRVLATLMVNVTDDFAFEIDDGSLTLREAIAAVNGFYTPTAQNGDSVQIDESLEVLGINDKIVFESTLSGDTINLDPAQYYLRIDRSVTIDASMLAAGITINGGGGSDGVVGNGNGHSVILISGGGGTQVEINGLTITGGDLGGSSAAGGIDSFQADLTLRNAVITGNAGLRMGSAYSGGVSVRFGNLTVENSTISGNIGRGIFFYRGENLTLQSTVIRDNVSTGSGGGLYAYTLNAQTVNDLCFIAASTP